MGTVPLGSLQGERGSNDKAGRLEAVTGLQVRWTIRHVSRVSGSNCRGKHQDQDAFLAKLGETRCIMDGGVEKRRKESELGITAIGF